MFLFVLTLFSCQKDKTEITYDNLQTVINPGFYEKTDNEKTIIDAKIVGDKLQVIIGASGCDGSSWQLQLADKGVVAESDPVQRFARIKFTNKELCAAAISKNYSFDLKPLRIQGDNRVSINLDGWNKSLLYVY